MEQLRQYVIAVIASAFICGIVLGVCPKGAAKELIKMICGLFLAFVVVRPISWLDISSLLDFDSFLSNTAAQTAAIGEGYSRKALRDIIKQETEAYILDKAACLDADITVDVALNDDPVPVPVSVQVTGNVSPYIRQQLTAMIQENLGIAKENQLWTQSP